jgi:hypothetical protein
LKSLTLTARGKEDRFSDKYFQLQLLSRSPLQLHCIPCSKSKTENLSTPLDIRQDNLPYPLSQQRLARHGKSLVLVWLFGPTAADARFELRFFSVSSGNQLTT